MDYDYAVSRESTMSVSRESTISQWDPDPVDMCSWQHKIHWSVVAVIVNVVSIVLFTTAVGTHQWAYRSYGSYSINTGLFQTCTGLNNTCYDTHMYFDGYDEKEELLASAVLNVFGLIGMYLFFSLAIFFLCGLFEEKQLATGALVTSYIAGLIALTGTILYAITIRSLDYSLSWSFILAIMGIVVNLAAGVLMCVGRNISTETRRKKQPRGPPTVSTGIEEVRMDDPDTTRKKIWSSGATP